MRWAPFRGARTLVLVRAIVSYALLRAALFVAPFAILVAAQVEWYVALVVALLFAFAASYVFLRRFRQAAVAEIARMRGERGEVGDEDAEDAAVDRAADAEDVPTSSASDDRDPRTEHDGRVDR
jgi:cytochrome c-type biogenesis protein CcmH/NrfG